ncbi:hypothetical protein FRB93_012050 [Tulasnella sp. JGI-2019a]|nr:hypothetical protein FRB93_012050 [Tulasnella sp. JGI-2019a]
MTQWLACQEAVDIHVAYINWLYPENVEEEDSQHDEEVIEVPDPGTRIEAEENDSGGAGDSDMDLDDESVDSDDSEKADTQATIIEHSVYDFAKTSPLPKLTSTVLSDHFGATKLLPAVKSYMKSLGDVRFKMPAIHNCFDVYKRVTFHLGMPGDLETVIVDQVQALPSKGPGAPHQLGKKSHFDTVLT